MGHTTVTCLARSQLGGPTAQVAVGAQHAVLFRAKPMAKFITRYMTDLCSLATLVAYIVEVWCRWRCLPDVLMRHSTASSTKALSFCTELTSVWCIDWTLCGSSCGKSNITVESGMRGAESMSIYRQLQQLQFAQRRVFWGHLGLFVHHFFFNKSFLVQNYGWNFQTHHHGIKQVSRKKEKWMSRLWSDPDKSGRVMDCVTT